MNKENILKVADAIETHSIRWLGFNMDSWIEETGEHVSSRDQSGHKCNTVACIGGWTDIIRLGLKDGDDYNQVLSSSDCETAAFLGLEAREGTELFHPYQVRDWAKITPAQAVAVLRHLAETGEVDWSVALPVQPVTEG